MYEKMLEAADLMERPSHYDFMYFAAPSSPDGIGCPLAWLAYKLGVEDDTDAALQLGYDTVCDFFDDMDDINGDRSWQDQSTLAASTFRKLAERFRHDV